MNEEQKYTPLSERLNQDVIHDNFVPKYSALATAPRTKLVMVGVWLIFGPWSLSVFALPFYLLFGGEDSFAGLLYSLMATAMGSLAVVILWSQTRRILDRRDPM